MIAYIGIAIAAALFFVTLHRFTAQSMQNKIGTTLGIVLLLVLGVWYEATSSRATAHISQIRFAFEHNKTLRCQNVDVHQSQFSYNVRSFIGKKNTPHFGHIFDAAGCEILP